MGAGVGEEEPQHWLAAEGSPSSAAGVDEEEERHVERAGRDRKEWEQG